MHYYISNTDDINTRDELFPYPTFAFKYHKLQLYNFVAKGIEPIFTATTYYKGNNNSMVSVIPLYYYYSLGKRGKSSV